MSTVRVTKPIAEMSPRLKARIAGVLYLVAGTAYTYADGSVRGKLAVAGDAAATAHNILTNASLLWRGFAADVLSVVTYLAVTLLLYDLLKPVNKKLSFSAAVFSLVGCTIQACTILLHLAPLVILQSGLSLSAFSAEQLQALALLSLKLRTEATNIYMVLFGVYCALLGYLIFKSTFLPRIVGAFLIVAGFSYQVFLLPPLAGRLFPYLVMPAGALGEGSLILWLMVMGVNSRRWNERASLAVAGRA